MKLELTHRDGYIQSTPTAAHAVHTQFACIYDSEYPMQPGHQTTGLTKIARNVVNRCIRENRGMVSFRKFNDFDVKDGFGWVDTGADGIETVTITFLNPLPQSGVIHEHRHTFTVTAK